MTPRLQYPVSVCPACMAHIPQLVGNFSTLALVYWGQDKNFLTAAGVTTSCCAPRSWREAEWKQSRVCVA